MHAGTIKWFDATKGYGFVTPQDGGHDVYLSAKTLQKANIEAIEPGSLIIYSVREKGGKVFVDEIEVIAPPFGTVPADSTAVNNVPVTQDFADAEEEFEREWGLRRA